MEHNSLFVQFSSFQESWFNVQNTLRPKYQIAPADLLSQFLSVSLSFFRFLIECGQLIPLSILRYNTQCNGAECIFYGIITPFTTIAQLADASTAIIVSIITVMSAIVFTFLILSSTSFRKRDETASNFRISGFIYYAFCLIYLADIFLVSFGQITCNFSQISCDSTGHYIVLIAGILSVVFFFPSSFLCTITSPLFDFKRIPGTLTSTRLEAAKIIWKLYATASFIGIHASDNYSSLGATSTVQAISIIFLIYLYVCHIVQCPYSRKLDNMLHAGLYGACLAVTVVDLIIRSLSDDRIDDVMSSKNDYIKVIFSVLFGCISMSFANMRQKQMSKLLEADINLMSANFDPLYSDLLAQVILEEGDEENPGDFSHQNREEDLNSRINKTKNQTSLKAINPQQPEPSVISDNRNNVLGTQKMTDNTDKDNSNSDESTANVSESSHKFIQHLQSNKPNKDAQPIPENEVYDDDKHYNYQNQTDNIIENTKSSNKAMGQVPQTNDVLSIERIKRFSFEEIAQARLRLKSYLESHNFAAISRSLIFDGDMELILRDISLDWNSYAPAQREIARASILQLQAALMIKSNSGGRNYSSYLIWFAVASLQLWVDVPFSSFSVKQCADNVTSIDVLYLCFLVQKACEETRNSILQSLSKNAKRSGSISDLASFRRWTSTARSLHEKALNSLRKFFKQLIGGGTNRIAPSESSKSISSADAQFTKDCRKSLSDSLSLIRAAENAYANLLQRFPTAPEAQVACYGFKRQFFRDYSGTKDASSLEEATTNSIASSVGSGLAESPKQQKLSRVEEVILKTFTRVRIVFCSALIVVVGLNIFFTMMNVKELGRVETLLSAFQQTASVFNILPKTCTTSVRATAGVSRMYNNFFSLIDAIYETNLNDITTRGNSVTGRDLTADITTCSTILSSISSSDYCYIAYSDGQNIVVNRNPDSKIPVVGTSLSMSSYVDNNDTTASWYSLVESRVDNSVFTFDSFYSSFGLIYDANGDPLSKFASYPIYYALNGADIHVQANPPFQGVLSVHADITDNDDLTYRYLQYLDDAVDQVRSNADTLLSVTSDLGMTTITDLLTSDMFTIPIHTASLEVELRPQTFSETIATFTSVIETTQSQILDRLDYSVITAYPDYRTLVDFCSSPNVINSNITLNYFADHLVRFVSNSLLIVTMCALSACIAAIIGAAITIKLVRSNLGEFDRCDNVSPALAILASFPRVELRRLARNVAALKVDRGIIDPDDDRASHYDLKLTKRQFIQQEHERQKELDHIQSNFMLENYDETSFQNPNKGNNMNVNNDFSQDDDDESDHFDGGIIGRISPVNRHNKPSDTAFDSPHSTMYPNSPAKQKRSINFESDSKAIGSVSMLSKSNLSPNNRSNKSLNRSGISSALTAGVVSDDFSIADENLSSDDEGVSNYGLFTEVFGGNYDQSSPAIDTAIRFSSAEEDDDDDDNNYHYNDYKGGVNDIDADHQQENTMGRVRIGNPDNVRFNGSPTILKGSNEVKSRNQNTKSQYNGDVLSSNNVKSGKKDESLPQKVGVSQPSVTMANSASNDDTTASHSTSKQSSIETTSKRISNLFKNFIRRPITRTYAIVWVFLAAYVVLDLIISRVAVGRYALVYNTINDLLQVSFQAALVSLHAPNVFQGTSYGSFRAMSTYSDYTNWFTSSANSFESNFVDLMDQVKGSTTVGRETSARSTLLFEPGCLSTVYPCTGDRDGSSYEFQEDTYHGLMRGVSAYSDTARQYMETYGDGSTRQILATNGTHWYFSNILTYDLEYGMASLRETFIAEALEDVNSDTSSQYIMLGVGIFLIVLMGAILEVSTRRQHVVFNDSLLLLRMIPTRFLDDYRVVERVLDVHDEEEDFRMPSNNAYQSDGNRKKNSAKELSTSNDNFNKNKHSNEVGNKRSDNDLEQYNDENMSFNTENEEFEDETMIIDKILQEKKSLHEKSSKY